METPKSNPKPTRNSGTEFNLDWLETNIDVAEVEKYLQKLLVEYKPNDDYKVGLLLKAVTCIDLTTLSGDDTADKVKQLCAKARQPIRKDILETLGSDLGTTVAAVCVYHFFISTAVEALQGTSIPVATVSAGFPAGLSPFKLRVEEIKASVAEGAEEIDAVIARAHVLTGNWQTLYNEIVAFKKACGKAHLKVILATGELGTVQNIYKASMVAMMAGADFIKTSTGKEAVNATLSAGLAMIRAIKDYFNYTGYKAGLKPAGGIRTANKALDWLMLVKEELGEEWLDPELFRFGTSSLLADIENQIKKYLS